MNIFKKTETADLSALLGTLPPFVFRTTPRFRELTGFSPRSIANLDSKGEGPPERIMIGRSVAYPRESFVKWLETRSRVILGG
jgi:predicted DNA-binding transcriptional regulator AlpA